MGWKPNRGLSDFDLVITFVSSRLALIREDVLAFGARPADSKSTDPAYQFQSQQCIPRDNLPLHLPRVCWPGISGHDDEGQCRSLPFECLHGLREADSIPEVWLREYQEPGFYPAPAVPVRTPRCGEQSVSEHISIRTCTSHDSLGTLSEPT